MEEMNILQVATNLIEAAKERLEVLEKKGMAVGIEVLQASNLLKELQHMNLALSVKAGLK